MSRSALLAALASVCALAAPTTAFAGTPATQEPVLVLEGQSMTCTPGSNLASQLSLVFTKPLPPSWAAKGVTPLPADAVRAWLPSGTAGEPQGKGYDQCSVNAYQLAARLKDKLIRFRDSLNVRYPGKNYTKIDLIAGSYGSTVSRLCIKTVPGCAQLVDDWIGIVPPSHGSQYLSGKCTTLPWSIYKYACYAAQPWTAPGTVVGDMNAGDETPYGSNEAGGWIDYTTVRAVNDGIITPAGSERLTGAVNFRSILPNATSTHNNWSGTPTNCPGSSFWPSNSGSGEALAAEAMDVTPRTAWLPYGSQWFDADVSCNIDVSNF